MINIESAVHKQFILLCAVVDNHQGSNLMKFAIKQGATGATCFRGVGTITSRMLKLLRLDDITREIVLIVLPKESEESMMDQLTAKFNIEDPNQGILFSMELAAVLGFSKTPDDIYIDKEIGEPKESPDYAVVMTVVDLGIGDEVMALAKKAGYTGATIIDARGAPSAAKRFFDMEIEPQKDVVMMVTEKSRSDMLVNLITAALELNQPNSGIVFSVDIRRVVGLYNSKKGKTNG
jgi:nitrogen regulatory protein PII